MKGKGRLLCEGEDPLGVWMGGKEEEEGINSERQKNLTPSAIV